MTRTLTLLSFLTLLLFGTMPQAMAQKQKSQDGFVLVIDPGHGGKDPGAIGKRGGREKVINLNVSKCLGNMIKDAYPEVKIIYTRSTDVFIPLIKRATIANKAKADLFISIHSNASKNRSARGCETFTLGSGSNAEAKAAAKYENEVILQEENYEQTYNGFDPRSSESYIIFDLIRTHDMEKSISCAEHMQRHMARRSGLNNRGVSLGEFLVLHQTTMPSILVELGFISNPKEEQYLVSKNGQKELAAGLFEGFKKYYEEHKRTKINIKGGGKSKQAPPASVPECAEDRETPQASPTHNNAPVFKVQILTSQKKLRSNDKRLKNVKADFYVEKGVYKYTCGASTDYNAILRKRRELSKKFKEAFIVAFKNGKRIDTAKAIEEFKKNNKK